MPHPRKRLSAKSKDFQTRFAIRLRKLLDARGIGPSEFVKRLRAAGLPVTKEAVKKWISGDRAPTAVASPPAG
jgi:hypothetical protein